MKYKLILTMVTTLLFHGLAINATAITMSPQQNQNLNPLPTNQGGGVLSKSKIKYPMKAQLDSIEGWVELQIEINESGNISAVEVINAKPARVFEDSALEAVKDWTFQQKLVNGKAKGYQLTQTIKFELVNFDMTTGQYEKDFN